MPHYAANNDGVPMAHVVGLCSTGNGAQHLARDGERRTGHEKTGDVLQ